MTLLFNGIRAHRRMDFCQDETKLLIAIHSTENNEMSKFWPWNEMKTLSTADFNDFKIKKGHLQSGWCEGWLEGSNDLEV